MPLSPAQSHTDITNWETKTHGTPAFPAACYLVELPGHQFKAHWHAEFELLYVKSGEIRLFADAQQFLLPEGTGAFINANVLHTAELAPHCKCALLLHIVFHPRLLGGHDESIYWEKYINPLMYNTGYPLQLFAPKSPEDDWQKDVLEWHNAAWEAIAHDAHGYEITARNRLSQILLALSDRQAKDTIAPSKVRVKNQTRLKDMLAYIYEHYFEPLTLEDLANAGGISKSACTRCFKEALDTTPLQYVKRFRLQAAANRLRETDWMVSEIGTRCGFEEMGYFAAQFKQLYGLTPSEYRADKQPKNQ